MRSFRMRTIPAYRETPLQKTLYACGELAGFITAISYVKPNRSVFEAGLIRCCGRNGDQPACS